jgi:hypothetical protein
MKKSLVIVIVIIELIILVTIGALLLNYRLKEIENRNIKNQSSVETEYINRIKDMRERVLVKKAFYFLPDELKVVLDFSIIPKVEIIEKGLWSGSYFGNKFPDGLYRVMFTANPKLYMDPAHNIIMVANDLKDEDRMMILPID